MSAPAPACCSARGKADSLQAFVLLQNKSYSINIRVVSPQEGNSLKWLRREWGRDGRSCLPAVAVHAASGISAPVGGQSEGLDVCSCNKSGPERGIFHLAKLPRCCCWMPMHLLHERLWFEMLKAAIQCTYMRRRTRGLHGQRSPTIRGITSGRTAGCNSYNCFLGKMASTC